MLFPLFLTHSLTLSLCPSESPHHLTSLCNAPVSPGTLQKHRVCDIFFVFPYSTRKQVSSVCERVYVCVLV
jgi:hypothetical protein